MTEQQSTLGGSGIDVEIARLRREHFDLWGFNDADTEARRHLNNEAIRLGCSRNDLERIYSRIEQTDRVASSLARPSEPVKPVSHRVGDYRDGYSGRADATDVMPLASDCLVFPNRQAYWTYLAYKHF